MITIVIPTMNRSDFLIRLLNYYADVGYRHSILIGDSSTATHTARSKQAIKSLNGKLKIIYKECPGLGVLKCIQHIVPFVSTPYTVLNPDDDFLIPNGLSNCIDFLEDHPDFGGANGSGIVVSTKSGGPHGEISGIGKYPLLSLNGENATTRLRDIMDNYFGVLFSVFRTDIFKGFLKIPELPILAIESELLPACLSVIHGKIMHLDCLYLVRQAHGKRYLLPNIYDAILNPGWPDSCETYMTILATELAKRDNIRTGEARDIVRQAFKCYLSAAFNKSHISSTHISISEKLRRRLKRYAALRKLRLFIGHVFPTSREEILMSRLYNRFSIYYDDFKAVHRSITERSSSN